MARPMLSRIRSDWWNSLRISSDDRLGMAVLSVLCRAANLCRERDKPSPTGPLTRSTISACRAPSRPCPRTSPRASRCCRTSRTRPAHLRHRGRNARLDRRRHVDGAAAAGAVDAGWRAPQHRHAERPHHADTLPARRRGHVHARGLPCAAGVAAAARADRCARPSCPWTTTSMGRRARRCADHCRIARIAVPAPAAADAQRPRLRALCQALLDAPGDPRTLDEWAATLNASACTLARHFQSETGLSFGAWRQQARVLGGDGSARERRPSDAGGARFGLRQR